MGETQLSVSSAVFKEHRRVRAKSLRELFLIVKTS